MVTNIYQIDWVLVDTTIIVLLFLLLLGVKIFKSTHRWRSNFSNEALEYYSFNNANLNLKGLVKCATNLFSRCVDFATTVFLGVPA